MMSKTFSKAEVQQALLVRADYGEAATCTGLHYTIQPGDRPGENATVIVTADVSIPKVQRG